MSTGKQSKGQTSLFSFFKKPSSTTESGTSKENTHRLDPDPSVTSLSDLNIYNNLAINYA